MLNNRLFQEPKPEIPVDDDRARLRQVTKLTAAIRRARRGEDLHRIAVNTGRIADAAEARAAR